MEILAIETSCDETAAAVVEDGVKLLSNVVASSEELHRQTGGIVPEVAAREQVKCIIPVVGAALVAARTEANGIDAIAVTVGPGLIGSLLIGVETAKALAYAWHKPLIAVNHLIGHVYGNFIEKDIDGSTHRSTPTNRHGLVASEASVPLVLLPAIVLVVSGGHTDLILLKNHGEYKWLGGTLDDAVGEAFDKAARILGLGYPGGPAISKAANSITKLQNYTITKSPLPRPLINDNTFDFSFSGLKTALFNVVRARRVVPLPMTKTATLAYEFQEAATDCLVAKTVRAAQTFGAKSILLAGGVAANIRLREKLGESAGIIPVSFPPFKFCTDNAAMIGSAAFFNQNYVNWENLEPDSSLSLQGPSDVLN